VILNYNAAFFISLLSVNYCTGYEATKCIEKYVMGLDRVL